MMGENCEGSGVAEMARELGVMGEGAELLLQAAPNLLLDGFYTRFGQNYPCHHTITNKHCCVGKFVQKVSKDGSEVN